MAHSSIVVCKWCKLLLGVPVNPNMILIVGTCCMVPQNCNVDRGCNLGFCLKVLTKFCYLVHWVEMDVRTWAKSSDVTGILLRMAKRHVWMHYVGTVHNLLEHNFWLGSHIYANSRRSVQFLRLMPMEVELTSVLGFWILSKYAIGRSFYLVGLTILPYLHSLSLYVCVSRCFHEVLPTTLPCLHTLSLYVIFGRWFREVWLTNFPCLRISACTWFVSDPSLKSSWPAFLVSASSVCTWFVFDASLKWTWPVSLSARQYVRDLFFILPWSYLDQFSLSPHSQYVRDLFSILPWSQQDQFSLSPHPRDVRDLFLMLLWSQPDQFSLSPYS